MSSKGKRTKSPANRNRFTNVGVAGRKTGVRVSGDVTIDTDGLENINEFFEKTEPKKHTQIPNKAPPAKSLKNIHTIHSPTPVRKSTDYNSLIAGALDIAPNSNDHPKPAIVEMEPSPSNDSRRDKSVSPELSSPLNRSNKPKSKRTDRRATIAPSKNGKKAADWAKSPPRRERRKTMANVLGRSQSAKLITPSPPQRKRNQERPRENSDALENDNKNTEKEGSLTVEDGEVNNGSNDNDNIEVAEENIEYPELQDSTPDEFQIEEPEISEEQDEEQEGEETMEQEGQEDLKEQEQQEESTEQEEHEEPSEPSVIDNDEIDVQPIGDTGSDVEKPLASETENPKRGKKGVKQKQRSGVSEPSLRRSSRVRIPPLAYWRNEHVEYEYERAEGSGQIIPKAKTVVRVRKTAEEKNQAKRRRRHNIGATTEKMGKITRAELDPDSRNQFYYYDDEDFGFPVENDPTCRFGPRPVDDGSQRGNGKRGREEFDDDDNVDVEETELEVALGDGTKEGLQEIVLSRGDIDWSSSNDPKDQYRVGAGLHVEDLNGERLANTGVLSLQVGGEKPMRDSRNNTLVYLVVSGKVKVQVHNSTFCVGILGQFIVPPNNTYSIRNMGTHSAQLFYFQIDTPEYDYVDGDAEEE